jgi:RNA polymerase sigma factor (sigma-70 family)
MFFRPYASICSWACRECVNRRHSPNGCLRWKKDKLPGDSSSDIKQELEAASSELPEEMLSQVQREQSLREAIATLPARCKQMVGMLFFEDPPRPYQEVAKELKLATGSIGFIRGRCLKKLRALLQEKGFR